MERFKCIGRQYMNFVAKDGNKVEGIRLHCVASPKASVVGTPVEHLFCSINRQEYQDLNTVDLPINLEVEFNRYGKPESYKICPKSKGE